MAIQAKDISVHLAGFNLLRQINLTIESGQVTAVVGPNGAGKSSLINVLTGDLRPTRGEVLINNKALDQWPHRDRANILAVLPQHSELSFPFTASEVVALGRIPQQTGYKKDQEIIQCALQLVDADYLQKRLYTEMSGGERQRVQLARVLAQIWEPCLLGHQFLVLDEPTSALDLSHQLMTLKIVRDLAHRGIGVLMVLHDLNLASRCADNLIVLNQGAVAAQGTPEQVISEALVNTVFGVEATISRHPVSDKPMVIT
jgi:iron complex transport system ATP-binding protein